MLDTYKIFISHTWKHNIDYCNLIELLRYAKNFHYEIYSNPTVDNLFVTEKTLLNELYNQIEQANIVMILTNMFVYDRPWVEKEINIATKYGKPIIALKSKIIKNVPPIYSDNYKHISCIARTNRNIKAIIPWNTLDIINAIIKYSS
jgi:hypothetical protein